LVSSGIARFSRLALLLVPSADDDQAALSAAMDLGLKIRQP
jgi:hypothetical protein